MKNSKNLAHINRQMGVGVSWVLKISSNVIQIFDPITQTLLCQKWYYLLFLWFIVRWQLSKDFFNVIKNKDLQQPSLWRVTSWRSRAFRSLGSLWKASLGLSSLLTSCSCSWQHWEGGADVGMCFSDAPLWQCNTFPWHAFISVSSQGSFSSVAPPGASATWLQVQSLGPADQHAALAGPGLLPAVSAIL